MSRVLYAILSSLLVCSSFAQTGGSAEGTAPERASGLTIALFGIVFVGLCVYFFIFVMIKDKKRRKEEEEAQKQQGVKMP